MGFLTQLRVSLEPTKPRSKVKTSSVRIAVYVVIIGGLVGGTMSMPASEIFSVGTMNQYQPVCMAKKLPKLLESGLSLVEVTGVVEKSCSQPPVFKVLFYKVVGWIQ